MLTKWLDENFAVPTTRRNFRTGLKRFVAFTERVPIEKVGDLDKPLTEYIKKHDQAAFVEDFKRFLMKIRDDVAPKTLNLYAGAIKGFFLEMAGWEISAKEWKRMRRRIMRPARAVTRDKAPTKEELRKILNHLDAKGRSLFLFLVSSGARVGEAVQLQKADLELNADPPRARIRPEYSKSETGRLVFFSHEARDAIKEWLKIKDKTGKRTSLQRIKKYNLQGDKARRNFGGPKIWPITTGTARLIWKRALVNAKLAKKDKKTGRFELHIHSLRKFFRSEVGLDFDVVNGLMGHLEYMDKSYLRHGEAKLAAMYKEAMPRVSIYVSAAEVPKQLQRRVAELEATLQDIEKLVEREVEKRLTEK